MKRTQARIRVDEDGTLEIIDPGYDSLALLREIDPGFRVRRASLPGFTTPRFLRTRALSSELTIAQLTTESEARLWEAHSEAMDRLRSADVQAVGKHQASLLALKCELARRILTHCQLCAHRCGVDRTRGERGICRLGTEAMVAEQFVHIAEEAPINPSLVLNLAGCGLRCRFCQQSALLTPTRVAGDVLEPSLWLRLARKGARSLSFVGGNPDESLFAILRFFLAAPMQWPLPIVWNCHAYSTSETLALLDGIVDAYVPDCKYGNDNCARRLSAISGYVPTAHAAIATMLSQQVPVIVRVLVLPGHIECCHAPTLDFLATLPQAQLFISVRGQYCPDWQITNRDGDLARRPTPEETEAVRAYAQSLNLTLID